MKNKKTLFTAIIVIIICAGIYFGTNMVSGKYTNKESSDAFELDYGKTIDLLYFYSLNDEESRDKTEILEIIGPDGNQVSIPEKNENKEVLFTPDSYGKYLVTFESVYIPEDAETKTTGLVKKTTTCIYPFVVK